MSVSALRRAQILLPLAGFLLVSAALLPWTGASGSDGRSRSWNVFGAPLLPAPLDFLVRLGIAATVCGVTWLGVTARLHRRTR